jgi:dihydroflavonol-4-reductase
VNHNTALVTGSTGFVGKILVNRLSSKGIKVRACIRTPEKESIFNKVEGVEPVIVDILDRDSLLKAMEGVDTLYHFAGLVDAKAPKHKLYLVNRDGTRNVWNCAVLQGIKKALYCSSTAVYGLLAKSQQPISENVIPRAVEPYGRSKFEGECVALEISARSNIKTVIIRPVAVFGPDQSTPFGRQLHYAAFSKLLLAVGFEKRRFNFVHVEDVAEASIHLMTMPIEKGQVYNIAVDRAIWFEEAFKAYKWVLNNSENPYLWTRLLAQLSEVAQKFPVIAHWLARYGSDHLVFKLWHPGFDLTYSSSKLHSTSFCFKWTAFEEILLSCINDQRA